MVERVEQMARAVVAHLQRISSVQHDARMAEAVATLDANDLLEGISYFRAHSATEQIAAINLLDELAREAHDVRLVVVDSIAFHFRQEFDDMARRTRVLNGLAQQLLELAERRGLAVVLVNQVTTKVQRTRGDGDEVRKNGMRRRELKWPKAAPREPVTTLTLTQNYSAHPHLSGGCQAGACAWRELGACLHQPHHPTLGG